MFRIQQDLPDLVRACLAVLVPNGIVLFSTNYESWNQAEFESIVLQAAGGKLRLLEHGRQSWDHELPHHPNVLKSAFFQREISSRERAFD